MKTKGQVTDGEIMYMTKDLYPETYKVLFKSQKSMKFKNRQKMCRHFSKKGI